MNDQKTSQKEKFAPSNYEAKWQKKWLSDKTFSPDLDTKSSDSLSSGVQDPYYTLMMFPYPSAEGMHVGNMYAHTGADIHARFKRMQGYNVFEPMGLDGFGIHSENYAMKVGRHPKVQAELSEKNFYKQMHVTGASFDWERTVETYNPEYYKWTQWLFTEMFKAGLAYKEKASVNFCPSCKTVLSDEQVIAGECERCGSIVEKKELEQWFFRITQYAGRLLDNLPSLDWSEKVKIAQTNWIGRSKGALIRFPIAEFRLKNGEEPNFVLLHGFKGSPDRNYLPWLQEQLEKQGYGVQVPNLPDSDNPTEEDQVSYVLENVTIDENTILVAHSLGSVVALKVVEKLKKTIAGITLVGGFSSFEFLDDKKRPYKDNFSWDFDWRAIKSSVKQIKVLHDSTETIISTQQAEELAKNLGVQVTQVEAREPHFKSSQEPEILKALIPTIEVFTTRPDTIFGANFVVIAPEHHIVKSLIDLEFAVDSEQVGKVKTYIESALKKSENERIIDGKDKTGVFTGLYALNPATEERVPIWIADYVLGGYGTGAIMAVPAHDQRDWEFAQKYELPIKHVVMPSLVDSGNPPQEGKENTRRTMIIAIVRDPEIDKYLILKWKKQDWKSFITGGVEEGENVAEAAKREVIEETGYTDVELVREVGGPTEVFFYAAHKGVNRQTKAHIFLFNLKSDKQQEVTSEENDQHAVVWMSEEEVVKSKLRHGEFSIIWDRVLTGKDAYVGDGLLQNSGELNGYHSKNDSDKIFEFISRTGIGEEREEYHLRDWLISRQRYWGPPIPMVYCQVCAKAGKSWFDTEEAQDYKARNSKFEIRNFQAMPGWYPVQDTELPVVLPDIADFKPEGTGTSPLANHPEFYTVNCPECGSEAKRETDVTDVFLDSAWYFLRYLATDWDDMPFPSEELAKNVSQGEISLREKNSHARKKFLPVTIYIGGAEHAVLHLLYARFTTMVLHDLGYLDFEEPFKKFFAHGLLIKEGAKMSKSKGNVIIPDEYIDKYGADTLRSYLMFLGPFNQGGDFYDSGIEGMYRFLRRIWVLLTDRVIIGDEREEITKARHKTIYGVTKDIEDFGYNTALSKLMEFYNLLTKNTTEFEKITVSKETIESLVKLLAPFAPHMTEELWERLGLRTDKSIHLSEWPEYDEELLVSDTVTIAIQVNGKRRGELSIASKDITKKDQLQSKAEEKVKKYLTGEIKKVIYVPGKIVNFVVNI